MKYTAGLKEIQDLKKINKKPKTQTNKTDLIQEKETRKNQRTTSSKLKRGSVKTAALGIDGCGGARTVKTTTAGIVEEWRRLESVVVDVFSGGG